MDTFKVGDKVKQIGGDFEFYGEHGLGKTGIGEVVRVSADYVEVKTDIRPSGHVYILNKHIQLVTGSMKNESKEPLNLSQKCSCELRSLLMQGCQCGGI